MNVQTILNQHVEVVIGAYFILLICSSLLELERFLTDTKVSLKLLLERFLFHLTNGIIVLIVGGFALGFPTRPPWTEWTFFITAFVFALNDFVRLIITLRNLGVYVPKIIVDFIEGIKDGPIR